MWLYTTVGFYSVVQDKNRPDHVMVRARAREDLDKLLGLLHWEAHYTILEWTGTDYAYRVFMPKQDWAALMSLLIQRLDYTNFKDECHRTFPTDYGRHSMLMSVWSVMKRWQDERRRPAGQAGGSVRR